MTRPLLLGHRGARGYKSIPENTLASFDRALADGCDGFEFDVRLTADGEAVVCHDAKVGSLEIARVKAERLPSLVRFRDVLDRYRKAFLDIELKVTGLEEVVISNLREFRSDRFVVSSFLPEVLQALHAAESSLPLGLICESKTQLKSWRAVAVEYVIPHAKLVNQELIQELKSEGKRILVWTVNSAEVMRRFAEWEVDGVISDRTKLLVASFSGR